MIVNGERSDRRVTNRMTDVEAPRDCKKMLQTINDLQHKLL